MIGPVLLAAAVVSIPRILEPGMDTSGYEKVPAPSIQMRMSEASATTVPWIDANGWRFLRGTKKALYAELPNRSAPLAAAEAFTYGVDAILQPPPEDVPALQAMLKFLASIQAPALPVQANVGLIDDRSEEFAEVLNLMSRRNLLYRVVNKPDPSLDVNIQIGSKQYPRTAVENPNDFAARVREQLTDGKRLVRLFGTYTVLAHLTGDGKRARLHLLNYSRRPVQDIRVRVLGAYRQAKLSESQDASQQAKDVTPERGAIEFTVPRLTMYAVVDLEKN